MSLLTAAVRVIQTLLPTTLLLAGLSVAAQSAAQQPSLATKSMLTVPAGTRLSLVPVRQISVKHTRPGDKVYLQITLPVTAGRQMAIPTGTYVQGVVDKISNDRHTHVLSMQMRSAEIIFFNGYTAKIPGPALAEPATVGMVVTAIAVTDGTVLNVGTPMEITLAAPLFLEEETVLAAIQQGTVASANAPSQTAQPPQKICWTPSTPATADTIIPATPAVIIPGTPAAFIVGNPPIMIPGTPQQIIPGSPQIIIPGSTGTSATPYPCYK